MNYIVETKNEYTIQLVNILTPLLYEGFESIYMETKKIISKGEENKILKTFQQFIKKIPKWNKNLVDVETKRIIIRSKCEWLLDLLKAVIKANIILLSNSDQNINGKFLINQEYLDIPLPQFIHKCYIECARQFYNTPYLFCHNIKSIDKKRNQQESLKLIKSAIREAIRKMLPVQHILREYLGNKYKINDDDLDKPISLNESENLKNLVKKDLNNFIRSDVVDNFVINEHVSNNSSCNYNNDKETINLLKEIKEKYKNGSLLEVISEKNDSTGGSIREYSSSNTKTISNDNMSVKNIEKNIDYEYSIKSRPIIDHNIHSQNTEKNNIEKSKDYTSKLEHTENNSFLSYKIEHDSEYEAVFSNIDNGDIINTAVKEKKKRKDMYFSKYNNI